MAEADKKAMMLGLGLDGGDGHKRFTKGENFVLAGEVENSGDAFSKNKYR